MRLFKKCPKCGADGQGQTTCPECGRCLGAVETMSRVTGFYRPVQQWNDGKVAEYNDRQVYAKPDTEVILKKPVSA